MAIYRGPGGAGDATNDATSQAILAAASAVAAANSEAAAASSATNAANSATAAASSATNASNSASSASTSASNASTSATNTASSATAAANSASAASTSETNAASSASAASTSATNAANSATSAANSATTATTQATNASNSATAAATSATNAANSATAAATSETNAAVSETNAATSETNAASSASAASSSATNAATSETNAASSASSASTSASNAATSETNAAGSATLASSSASTATTQATNSANSATAAATSATNAAASAVDAQSSEDAAAAYAASINPANFLTKANNLSDLTNTSTARTNLGVAIGTNVQAYSSELQAISNGGGNAMCKNHIINGAMMIDQRNAGALIPSTGNQYTVDRWVFYNSQSGKLAVGQNAAALTPPVGFTNYLGFVSSSAYSVLATDYFVIDQCVEGLNVSDLAWGTANAKTVTLSFQVYSSLTGTFGGAILNSASNRSYPFTYTVSTPSTWVTASVTIPGDISGTWLTTNGIGMRVRFSLGVGSNNQGTPNTWQASGANAPTGTVSVVGTNGAVWAVTGVQLEKGSTATSFDYRPYGTELALCQRYYIKTYNQGTVAGTVTANGALFQYRVNGEVSFTWQFPQVMRTTPTLTFYGKDTGTSGKVSCGSTEFNGGTNGTVNGDKNNIIYASGLSGSTDCYVQAVATAEL